METAIKKVCKENHHDTILIGTEQVPQPHELETIQVLYCPTCNCTWKEA